MVICAEIPDKEADSDIHYTMKPLIIDGLCGAYNKNSTCVKDIKCCNEFPKPFLQDRTR